MFITCMFRHSRQLSSLLTGDVRLELPIIKMSSSGYVDNWQSDKSLQECNMHMLSQEIESDVSFRVGEERSLIRAHRYPLISRSCVFQAMLCGPLAEKEEITIPDVEKEGFADFLRYIYTDTPVLTPENATTMLYLAKKYAVEGLESLCIDYLGSCLTKDTACNIIEQAHRFGDTDLRQKALKFIQKTVVPILNTSASRDLCPECFRDIITSVECRAIPEIVFTAALTWSVAECRRRDMNVDPLNKRLVLQFVIHDIYFPDMDEKFFVKEVVPSQVLSEDEEIRLLSHFVCADKDISPFKTRNSRRFQSVPNTYLTFPVELYESHAVLQLYDSSNFEKSSKSIFTLKTKITSKPKVANEPAIFKDVSKTGDVSQFTEDLTIDTFSKMILHGFHIHGSGRQHIYINRYQIKIFKIKRKVGRLLHDLEVALDPQSNKYGVSECHLATPILLEAGTMYLFKIRLLSGDSPLYVGHRPNGPNSFFSAYPRSGSSLCLLSALILSEKPEQPSILDPSGQ